MCYFDYVSQRGGIACDISRAYLVMDLFSVEHQGKGCFEARALGNAAVLAGA